MNPFKNTLCIFIIIASGVNSLQAQWESLGLPLNFTIHELTVLGDTVYATANEQIFRSTDGGNSWSELTVGRGFYIHPDTKEFYRVNPQLTIFKSSDFGQNWVKIDSVPKLQPYYDRIRLAFDGPRLYAYSKSRLLRRDSMNAWTSLLDVVFDSIQNCVARGNKLWMATYSSSHYSTDGGYVWNDLFADYPPFGRHSLTEVGDTLLFCSSNFLGNPDGFLYRSTDFGSSWQSDSTHRHLIRVFRDNRHFYAADAQNNIFISPNGLTDWDTLRATRHGYPITDVAMVQNKLLLSTSAGVIQKDASGRWLYAEIANSANRSTPGYGMLLRFQNDVLLTDRSPVIYSPDLGDTWIRPDGYPLPEFPLPAVELDDILFIKNNKGLMRCVDDGRFDWQPTPTPPFTPFVMAGRDHNLYVVETGTVNPRLFRSTDYGDTWTQMGIAPSFETFLTPPSTPNNFFGLDSLLFGLVDDVLYVSDDEGQSWQPRYDFNFSFPFQGRLVCTGQRIFLLYFPEKKAFVSTDMGLTFNQITTPNSAGSFIFRVYDKTCLLSVNDGFLYHSRDFGVNWTKIQSPRAGFDLNNSMDGHATRDSMLYLMDSAKGLVWRINVDRLAKKTGIVFLDYDSDGLQDSIEPGVKNIVVRARKSSQFFGVTDTHGRFDMNIVYVTDTLEVATVLAHFAPNPAYRAVQAIDTATIRFALQPLVQAVDIAVNLVNTANFRPGFENNLSASVVNNGLLPATGIFSLVLDPLTTLQDVVPLPDSQSGDTLYWQYVNLLPLQSLKFQIRVKTGLGAGLGYVVNFYAQATTSLTDISLKDNNFHLESIVVGAFDPNDKTVLPLTIPPLEALDGESLTYTIRFQNTGTFPTEWVILHDTLPLQVDPASVRILDASHPFRWSIQGRTLIFRFDPLALPAMQENEPESHGFIQFTVEMKTGAMLNDTVTNTAYIYFDFNPPIITNKAQTVVTEQVSGGSSISQIPHGVRIFPNPAIDEVWIDWSGSVANLTNIRLLTVQGVVVKEIGVEAQGKSIQRLDLSILPNALYFIELEFQSRKYHALIYKD